MIRGIIIDVDGVIVGEKNGYNFPEPHPDVIARLKKIEAKGIQVSLCTAKPLFAIQNIIDNAGLHSLHITNGGGVITDPLDDITLKTHFIDKEVAKQVVQICLDHNTYVEIYSVAEYFAQASQESDITRIHSDILQHEPYSVNSLIKQIDKQDTVKIMPIVHDDSDMEELDHLLEDFKGQVTVSWSGHPVALPRRFGIVTAPGISKQQAALEIAKHTNISPDELLGIGDGTNDWQFIQECGYAGAMGNASDKLKHLVTTKGDRATIGGSVDQNGVLEIFDYFGVGT